MCGIAAIFAYSADAPHVDRDELIAIRDHMIARGPDGSGEWFSPDGRVALGHRRLAIIDLSAAGAQPMWNAERTLCVTFNGEIYNYQALRAQLQARGCVFRSNSDTEVLLHLYAQKGADMVHDLRGMFAFALWDDRNRCLFLARDPFGIKPLYYADDGRTIRIASQVKALLQSKHIDTSPDPAGHVGFFLWGHIPDPFTIFNGIKALPAGHTLTISACQGFSVSAFSPRLYCSIPEILRSAQHQSLDREGADFSVSASQRFSISERSALLRTALSDSISHHLIADVPVGVFQSAGLDSSTITAFASEAHPNVRTVTLGFNEYRGTDNDEVPLAETVARSCGTTHKTVWVARADFEASADALLNAMDRPSIDGVNTYFVSKAARESGLKVALSGLGGDELFGGYPSFRDVPRLARAGRPLASFPALGRGFRVLTAPVLKRFTSPKYAGLFEYGSSYGGAYLLRRGLFMPWELPEFLDPDLVREGWQRLNTLALLNQTAGLCAALPSPHQMGRGAGGEVGASTHHASRITDRISDRLRVSAIELTWYMRHQLLRDADWAGMAHSLEIRVPLVDVELLRQIAPLLGSQTAPTKLDMAHSPRSPLPAALLSRPKTGFSVPVHDWLLQSTPRSEFRVPHSNDRGLRGWARHVYARFGGTSYTSPRSRVFPSANVSPSASQRFSVSERPPPSGSDFSLSASQRFSVSDAPPRVRAFVLLTDGFGGFGGIAKFNRDFLTALCSHPGIAEVVALPRLAPEPTGPLPDKLTNLHDGLGGKRRYFRAVIQSARRLRLRPETFPLQGSASRITHHESRTIIFCAHINLLPFAFVAHCILRAPIVLNLHGIEAWSRHRNPVLVSLLRRVSAFISVSEFTRERFLSWSRPGSQPFFILPNCVDLSAFSPGPRNTALVKRHGLGGRQVIMTLARLPGAERYKGIDEVLEVLPQLAAQVPNITYLICGDGDDRARLVAKARALGCEVFNLGNSGDSPVPPGDPLSDQFPVPEIGNASREVSNLTSGSHVSLSASQRFSVSESSQLSTRNSQPTTPSVVFTGRIHESEKADYLRLADAFVMPGRREGFGIVYLEALACGIPVIGSKLDGSREALRHGKLGALVDPRNGAEIVSAVLDLLQSIRQQGDHSNAVSGVEYFSFDRFQQRVHAIIDAIVPAPLRASGSDPSRPHLVEDLRSSGVATETRLYALNRPT